MKLARKIQHRRHPSRQATQTKAEDGDTKEDKEGDKEGEADDAPSDSKEKDMRRLPPQGKEKTCGSPRVTLKIHQHQVKDKREKKNSVDHEPHNGNMESGKGADENGSGKEASAVEESQAGGGDRSSPSDKEPAGAEGALTVETPTEKTAEGAGQVAGVKRSHSTEDETSGGAVGEDGKKRRRKDDKGKSGSNSGGSPKSLVSIESEGEDAKSVESPGPKVPPLKIVISGASLEEPGPGGRNGKNGSGRHHLPYIVSAQPEAPDASPAPVQTQPVADESKEDRGPGSGEEGGAQPGAPVAGGPVAGGGRHQRVLRSHRGKKGEGRSNKDKDKDKDSNSTGGSATSSPAGMGEVSSPRQVSPTPGTGSEVASEGEEKPSAGGPANAANVRGDRDSTSGRDSDVEKTATPPPPPPQELHPRKRKIRPRENPPPSNGTNGSNAPAPSNGTNCSSNSSIGSSGPGSDSGADASLGGSIGTSAALESITNSYQLFLNIRKQIERKRKGLFPVQPKPPQGFKDYLMNRCTYVLANNNSNRVPPPSNKPPVDLHAGIKELFLQQEKERHRLLMQHVIEKEKLVLSVEQEILRVHGRAARALANQALPFSACTILRDEEVYSAITPEQEEKDRNARSRYNGRLFLSWLQDVDDKWEKIKEAMLLRHHNEAESLHAVQKMDWEWKMKELAICEMKSSPVIDETHVPVVHVSDDFDLLPA